MEVRKPDRRVWFHQKGRDHYHPSHGVRHVALQQQSQENNGHQVEHQVDAIEPGADDPVLALRHDRNEEGGAKAVDERRNPLGRQLPGGMARHRVVDLPVGAAFFV